MKSPKYKHWRFEANHFGSQIRNTPAKPTGYNQTYNTKEEAEDALYLECQMRIRGYQDELRALESIFKRRKT